MQCRVCDGSDLELVIDLGNQPWCNGFLKHDQIGSEPFYPLRVFFCQNCKTAQLDFTVKKEIMFADHTYLSGVTNSLSAHFKNIAVDSIARFKSRCKSASPRVLDIGSNDGTQLLHFIDLGAECIGVESSKTTAEIAQSRGVNTLNKFFNYAAALDINGKFDIINAAGVFFHLEELHSACEGVKHLLAPDGTFIVQFLYMRSIIENNAFDQIYHEHLLYYTVTTLNTLLGLHGLEIYDAYLSEIHGGSIIASICHKGVYDVTSNVYQFFNEEMAGCFNDIQTYKNFARRIEALKVSELNYLQDAKNNGRLVYGLGAPVKGNTLLNYFGITTNLISFLTERNQLRNGLYSPGSHIKIIMEDELLVQPDIYYVLAWNFKNEILHRNKALIECGVEFHFPVNPKQK